MGKLLKCCIETFSTVSDVIFNFAFTHPNIPPVTSLLRLLGEDFAELARLQGL
jgi:hypothetical protein